MPHKVLVLNQEEADQYQLSGLKSNNDIKALFSENTFKWQLFEQFQEGAREDKYGFVIAYLKGMSSDDVEMSEEFYQHYAAAPVIVWIITEESDELSAKLKEFNSNSHSIVGDEENIGGAFKQAYDWAVEKHLTLFKDEVEPAFKKFDKDGSGAIDKDELGQLMKDLGNELNEEQLTEALKDLDLNGDGVIDLKEFSRWYFTGMKPYKGTRRSMLKAGATVKKIFDAVAEQAKLAMIGQELKMKSHSISVGFNRPEKAGTHIEANLWLGGKSHVA